MLIYILVLACSRWVFLNVLFLFLIILQYSSYIIMLLLPCLSFADIIPSFILIDFQFLVYHTFHCFLTNSFLSCFLYTLLWNEIIFLYRHKFLFELYKENWEGFFHFVVLGIPHISHFMSIGVYAMFDVLYTYWWMHIL